MGAFAPIVVLMLNVFMNGSTLWQKNEEKLDWKRSIVDLMKLVGMDSSLTVGDRHSLAPDAYLQNMPLIAP